MHRWVGGLKGTKSGMLARPVPLQKGERACVVGVQGLCPIINFAGGLKQQKPGHTKSADSLPRKATTDSMKLTGIKRPRPIHWEH